MFTHDVPSDAEGAHLKEDQALVLVKAFIQKQKNIDLSNYSLTDSHTTEKEKRIDHYFTWKASSPYLGEAKLIISAFVYGDRVQEYVQRIEYPEKFSETYEQERSKGELLAKVSKEFTYLLVWAAIVIAVIANKDKIMPWKGALLPALAMAFAGLLQDINSIPDMKSFDYAQLPPYTLWGEWILETVESNLFSGVKTFALAIAGWVVCEKVFMKNGVNLIARSRDLLSRDFTRASFMGYLLACIGLGYVTVFT
jgi:hypothetical protein